MKILHFADVHSRDKDIEEVEKCLNFIVEAAEREKVDLIVSAGDWFHSQEIKLDSLSAKLAIKTVSRLANIAPVAIVIGTPSHEGRAPEILSFARGKYDVHVSSMPEQIYLYQGCFYDHMVGNLQPEAVITLCPPPTKQFFQSASDISGVDQEIGAAMAGLFAGLGAEAAKYDAPHILIYHGSISGAKLSTGQTLTGMDIEISVDQMNMTGADLHLLGHIHKAQQLGDRSFYSGSIYHENWGEQEDKGFYIHEDNDFLEGWLSTFIATPCKKLVRYESDLTAGLDVGLFMDTIANDDVVGAHMRIDLTAWQDAAPLIDKNRLIDYFMSIGAVDVDIRVTPVPRVTVRAAAVLSAERLRDKVTKRADLAGDEVDEDTLGMADLIEDYTTEKILEMVAGGQG